MVPMVPMLLSVAATVEGMLIKGNGQRLQACRAPDWLGVGRFQLRLPRFLSFPRHSPDIPDSYW
eukprot:3855445-Pyramimonas_sp.AAC.1